MFNYKKSIAALAVAASLGVAAPAFADNSAGSVYGVAKQGQTVKVVNKATGAQRTIVVDESGRFNFNKMPTGKYEVSNGTETYTVTVAIGTGTNVRFIGDNVERIEVKGARVSAIDTTSVESSTVFTQEQLEDLPIARDLTSVALLAPGTVKGDTGFGNLASFGGASVAENGYFINGFDVTNIRNFISFADLPFDAVAQQQVKTGGYGAEYGRSLGGVVSLVTKRGSNEFKAGGAVYFSPESLRESGTNSISRDPDRGAADQYYAYRSENEYSNASYNVWASGPIIEDTLFFFGMVEGRNDESDVYGSSTSSNYKNTSPQSLLKLDWNISDNHILEFTYIENENVSEYIDYDNTESVVWDLEDDAYTSQTNYYTGKHGVPRDPYTITTGGDVKILNYTGYITNDLTITALYGKLTALDGAQTPDAINADCPLVYDRRDTPSSSQYLGCWSQTYVPDQSVGPDEDVRESVRLGLEWVIGDHNIRAGYDSEEFTSSHQGTTLTGGEYWRWHVGTGAEVAGEVVPAGETYVRHLVIDTVSSSFKVENTAWYIEDSWQVTDEWLAYIGIRAEGFTNYNGDGDPFVEADNEIAPRLGFTWDVGGEGTKKLFGTWGRYYIPVASNTNIRASGAEIFIEDYYYADSANEDPRTGAPTVVGAQIGDAFVNGSTEAPDPRTVSATNLSPMHQDELILGYQQEFDVWTLGVRYINREVKDGMDDYCSHQPFIDWAEDNGYDNFDYNTMAGCLMMNPGRDFSVALDLENDGNLTEVTIPQEYFGLDPYKREYQALEFFWEKPFDDGWYVQGSWTIAESTGNAEGYVNSGLEQADAGLTQDLDNALFQDGADGALPNDRRHTLKLFGVRELTDELMLSANLIVQSGRPVSCLGYAPLNDFKDELGVDYSGLGAYGPSSFYCGGELGNRGDYGRTPWTQTIDMGLSYKPTWAEGLTLKMDIRNILNKQQVTEYNETGDTGSGAAPEPNPNFLTPANYQAPRRVTFTARYTF